MHYAAVYKFGTCKFSVYKTRSEVSIIICINTMQNRVNCGTLREYERSDSHQLNSKVTFRLTIAITKDFMKL